MANEEQVARLRLGVKGWNRWRRQQRRTRGGVRKPNLRGANLTGLRLQRADLKDAKLTGANLPGADLTGARLTGADLTMADLTKAQLSRAELSMVGMAYARLPEADLTAAKLDYSDLSNADLCGTTLARSSLSQATLVRADLTRADLHRANLETADLTGADLSEATLQSANLRNARLVRARLVRTNLAHADLTGCQVFGAAAWGLDLTAVKQHSLVVTDVGEPRITVDNLHVAQFVYLLLKNEEIRDVIDTITSKVVLILGRFSKQRKPVLDALRRELRRKYDYLPIVFDFPRSPSVTPLETLRTLANLSRFVIADLTDARAVLQEMQAIIPDRPSLPVQPLLKAGKRLPGPMSEFLLVSPSVLRLHIYENTEDLLGHMTDVIEPPEAMFRDLERRLAEHRLEMVELAAKQAESRAAAAAG